MVDNEIVIESYDSMTIDEIKETISVICEECLVTNDRVSVNFEDVEMELSMLEISCFGLIGNTGQVLTGLKLINKNIDIILERLNQKDYRVIHFF